MLPATLRQDMSLQYDTPHLIPSPLSASSQLLSSPISPSFFLSFVSTPSAYPALRCCRGQNDKAENPQYTTTKQAVFLQKGMISKTVN